METMQLPDDIKVALDEKVFVHVATVNPDGSPQVSVVWMTRRGDTVLFSTAEGRVKPRNIAIDPRIALSFSPPENTGRNIVMQGRVTHTATDGTWLIDELANKYLGHDSYQFAKPGEVRVNYEIEIDRISTWG
jgi:PPOX class probable F420-dependent enzyme